MFLHSPTSLLINVPLGAFYKSLCSFLSCPDLRGWCCTLLPMPYCFSLLGRPSGMFTLWPSWTAGSGTPGYVWPAVGTRLCKNLEITTYWQCCPSLITSPYRSYSLVCGSCRDTWVPVWNSGRDVQLYCNIYWNDYLLGPFCLLSGFL